MIENVPNFNPFSSSDLVEVLPYLVGQHPDNSIVIVGLQEPSNGVLSTARLDLPADPAQWPRLANDLIRDVLHLSHQAGTDPRAVVLYLCPDPQDPLDGSDSMRYHRALADQLAAASERHHLKVLNSLFVTRTRWWSYTCPDPACCPPDGTPATSSRPPGPITAGAQTAGISVPPSRADLLADLAPITGAAARAQHEAILRAEQRWKAETAAGPAVATNRIVRLLDQLLGDGATAVTPAVDEDLAADLIVALQERLLRDFAGGFTKPEELPRAQHLWRQLATRCVEPHHTLAAAPLTLLAATAWAADDTTTARIALRRALEADPHCTLAELFLLSLNRQIPFARIGRRARELREDLLGRARN